jgi:exopolysaccharide biosynthesis polyprenyl glycosylphosphotransferase
MIRLFHSYFPVQTLALGITEAIFISLAFMAATFIRFGSSTDLVLGYEHGLEKILIVALIFVICMYYLDLYDYHIVNTRFQVLPRLMQVVGVGSVLLALLYYLFPPARLGPFVIIGGSAFAVSALTCWRKLFPAVTSYLKIAEPIVLVGTSPLAAALESEVNRRPELGFKFLGFISKETSSANGLRRLGSPEELAEVVSRERVSRVVIATEERRGQLPLEQLLALKPEGVIVQDGSEMYEMITGKVYLETLRPSSLLFSGFHVSRWLMLYKRLFSILFASLGLLLTSPLMLLIAIAVRLDSPGPVIFRQHRVGRDSRLFVLFKFRTMRDRPLGHDHSVPAQQEDDRFTRVGRWLRRTRLDELPQLYNILRGDMYFVGPRPFMARQEADLVKQVPFYRYRWLVRPGASGWAQVNRGYCLTQADNAEKLAYDLYYIRNMSFGLDLLILFRTLKILLLGRGAQ